MTSRSYEEQGHWLGNRVGFKMADKIVKFGVSARGRNAGRELDSGDGSTAILAQGSTLFFRFGHSI